MKTFLSGVPSLPPRMVCELYEIRLASGVTIRHNTSDIDVAWGGHTFYSSGPQIERGAITSKVGTEVQEAQITIHAALNDFVSGVPYPQFVNAGGFDRAWVDIWRARQDRTVHLFRGVVTDSSATRVESKLTLSSGQVFLNILMPRNTYQPGCLYSVYDAGCGLSKESFATPSTVGAGSTARQINCGLAQASGYFDFGFLIFTSGANAGASVSINHSSPGVLYLATSLPATPDEGDAFTAYPGCDGRRETCQNKFNNLARNRSFPFVPAPEAAV